MSSKKKKKKKHTNDAVVPKNAVAPVKQYTIGVGAGKVDLLKHGALRNKKEGISLFRYPCCYVHFCHIFWGFSTVRLFRLHTPRMSDVLLMPAIDAFDIPYTLQTEGKQRGRAKRRAQQLAHDEAVTLDNSQKSRRCTASNVVTPSRLA